jgi:hypothetical protein
MRPRKHNVWTAPEIKRLMEAYPVMDKQGLIDKFPRHSLGSIGMKAKELGIKRFVRRRNWTAICEAHVMQSGWFEEQP